MSDESRTLRVVATVAAAIPSEVKLDIEPHSLISFAARAYLLSFVKPPLVQHYVGRPLNADELRNIEAEATEMLRHFEREGELRWSHTHNRWQVIL